MPIFPASGVDCSAAIDNIPIGAAVWTWSADANVIPTPSFFGGDYMEFAVGKSTNILTMAGTYNLNFNPFLNGLGVGSGGIGSGLHVVSLFINNLIVASSSNVIIKHWDIDADSDGVVSFNCIMYGDWVFNDFSNTPAATY